MVLEQRIPAWAEDHEHRAQTQAGFRKGMRSTDQLFILRDLFYTSASSRNSTCSVALWNTKEPMIPMIVLRSYFSDLPPWVCGVRC
jgi:hypothetical protein